MKKLIFSLIFCLASTSCMTSKSIFQSVEDNDVRGVQEWLDKGGNPNEISPEGASLLFDATGPKGGIETVVLLLSRGANPNLGQASCTPLMNACSWLNVEAAKILIQYGADAKIKDFEGRTALQYIAKGNSELERELGKLVGDTSGN